MKGIATALNRTFTVEAPTDDYGKLVQKTSKLIKRSFIATLRMVDKWEPGYLASLYDDCLGKWQDRGFESPSHMWWTERKKINSSKHKTA